MLFTADYIVQAFFCCARPKYALHAPSVDGISDALRGGLTVANSLGRDAAKGCSNTGISAKASDWLSRGSPGYHRLV